MNAVNEAKRQRRLAQLEKKAATIKKYASKVEVLADNYLTVDGHEFRLVANYKDGFKVEQLEESFSDILLKYDYVVGDWAYEQLRMHGFYQPRAGMHLTPLKNIEYLADYLNQYCNFGCAYFVLENMEARPKVKQTAKKKRKNQRKKFTKKASQSRQQKKNAQHKRKNYRTNDRKNYRNQKNNNPKKHNFKIRQKEF